MHNSSLTVTANMLIQLIHCVRGKNGFCSSLQTLGVNLIRLKVLDCRTHSLTKHFCVIIITLLHTISHSQHLWHLDAHYNPEIHHILTACGSNRSHFKSIFADFSLKKYILIIILCLMSVLGQQSNYFFFGLLNQLCRWLIVLV